MEKTLNQQLDITDPKSLQDAIDYDLLLDCVHCGLCTAACPTYLETGDENDSPRGRIYLMRAVIDERTELTDTIRGHLDLCLDCRACESACPSGVQYGNLIEPFRNTMQTIGDQPNQNDWFKRWILLGLFPNKNRLQLALKPALLAQRIGLMGLLKKTGMLRLLPLRLRQLVEMLPPPEKSLPALPEFLPAIGTRRASVALFTGCVSDVMFRKVNWATARVLQQNGCDVFIPQEQGCCGAIHFHTNESATARDLADQNTSAFDPSRFDAIISNVAGCGAMLKEYGHHWNDDSTEVRKHFASKVQDINEYLDTLGLRTPLGVLDITATYHDACHLAHAQQIRSAPRKLLSCIPGLKLTELPESEICCGAAGIYNMVQPEMATRLSERKMQNIRSTGARVLVSSNTGCTMQIAREARVQGENIVVVHPMELLDWSYQNKTPDWSKL